MSEPSAINWKQYSLVGGLVAAIMVLLGFIANAIGIIEIRLPGTEDDTATPIGGASPSDITVTGTPTESASAPDPSDTTEAVPSAEGTWITVYEEQTLYLDSFLSGTDACGGLGFELDAVGADGTFQTEPASIGESADHVDLIWDPCFEEGLVHLDSGENSFGSLWAEGTEFDAASCQADFADIQLNLGKVIDPRSPHETWFSEGQLLCMLTSDGQIVLADLTSVEPATDEYPGLQATFEMTLWARA